MYVYANMYIIMTVPAQVLSSAFSLYPELHWHVYAPGTLLQTCWQALVALELHSLTSGGKKKYVLHSRSVTCGHLLGQLVTCKAMHSKQLGWSGY